MKTKTCTKCKKEKLLSEFYKNKNTQDGYKSECITCYNKKQKEYRNKNKEKIRKYHKNWYNKNREKRLEQCKIYVEKNKEKRKQYIKEYNKKNRKNINKRSKKYNINKRKIDINFRLSHNLRSRINKVLQGKTKSLSTIFLIGCEIDYLMYHIQKQFKTGMNWDNYGEWHIDHKRPCASFDLSKPSQQKECFNYSNLQPLWAEENFRKNKNE